MPKAVNSYGSPMISLPFLYLIKLILKIFNKKPYSHPGHSCHHSSILDHVVVVVIVLAQNSSSHSAIADRALAGDRPFKVE